MERKVRNDLFLHDLVHDNPGLVKYQSAYNQPLFLRERGYDGKTFDLYNCAQYGLLWDGLTEKFGRKQVYPEGSEARAWVIKRKAELQALYKEATDAGLAVSFMMDMIVLPIALTEIYPEILNEKGEIDIALPMTQAIMEEMFEEMFSEFSWIKGIYVRYGETYTGAKYDLPYHVGNNPILKGLEYHFTLIDFLIDTVCKKHNREIYYRTWGFGAFQYDKKTYLEISERIPAHPKFYFCIKHTSGDFNRCMVFNQSLNSGKHQQIVEVQAAREYEGKGAYPNYIADGVINGFEEFKWLMRGESNRSLRDVINVEDSLIKGLWTWSRGGGWDGPYINGRNGKHGEEVVKNGSELWCDLNAYVLSKWAKNTEKSDRDYALEYAREILKMSEVDCRTFYELCLLSARAVLLGRGCDTDKYKWKEFWTRDQNINPRLFDENIQNAMQAGAEEELLWERRQSVAIWRRIVELSKQITTGNSAEYIRVTSEYGYYLYALYETMFRANVRYLQRRQDEVDEAIAEYEALWVEWQRLKAENDCCPTLFIKENKELDLICYKQNYGFDHLMDRLRR